VKIYNWSDAVISSGTVVLEGQVIEVPDHYTGVLDIDGTPIEWDDDGSFQYMVITNDIGGYAIESPVVPGPPVWQTVFLFILVGGISLTVKILQKVRSG